MHCRHGDVGLHGLGEGVLEEAPVCPTKDASIVGVQLDMYNLLVMGARNGDCGGESYFDRCFNGGQHCICLMLSHGDDEVGEL
jgi:hypothetical protein